MSPSSLLPSSGRNQFQGCYCRGLCEKKTCPCFSANRECDADLCKTCGAGAVVCALCIQCVDGYSSTSLSTSVEDFSSKYTRCKNIAIQRGQRKVSCGCILCMLSYALSSTVLSLQHLLVAPSEVAGWGCFTKERVEKNEFVAEYCGEVRTVHSFIMGQHVWLYMWSFVPILPFQPLYQPR